MRIRLAAASGGLRRIGTWLAGFGLPLKAAAVLLTAAMTAGAILIGGGVPPSPARVADATEDAARNSEIAADHTARAARDTRALAEIADNVASQLTTSRKLLSIQQEIERSTRRGAQQAARLAGLVSRIGDAIEDLERRLRRLAARSSAATAQAQRAAQAGDGVRRRLDRLRRRFRAVVRESRELNRKARGYERLRELP